MKVKKLNNQDPKKWWNECKRLCGMSNPKKDILAKLLPEDSQTLEEKTNLANKIDNIFLEPQQAYELLNEKNRVDTTNAMPLIITTETSGVANSIIGGAHIHIFEFTDHENNRFQTKLTVQNMNI